MYDLVQIPSSVFFQAAFDATVVVQGVLFVTTLLAGSLFVGRVVRHFFNMPEVAGQILGGMLLGPSGLDIAHVFNVPVLFQALSEHAETHLFTCGSSDLSSYLVVMLSATFAVPALLWMAGHETDIESVSRVGFSAVVAGILGAILPIGMISSFLYIVVPDAWSWTAFIGMGLVFAATSVSISIAVFFAYDRMHGRAAQVTLGAAVIDDIVAVILLSLYMAFGQNAQGSLSVLSLFGHIAGALLLMMVLGYYGIRPFVAWVSKHKWYDLLPSIAVVCMGIFFVIAETVGHLAGVTGAYFAGLFHRMGDAHHAAEKKITPFVQAIFLPLFLGSIGLQVNMRLLQVSDWILLCGILVLAIISKIIACFCTLFIDNYITSTKKPWNMLEMWIFGTSMVARGEVGLIVSTILYGAHIFSQQQYVIAVVVVTLTTIISPILLVPALKKIRHDDHH